MEKNNHPALSIVVLAAGLGTRMKSTLPKVLHSIGGKPLLSHVLDTAASMKPAQIIVVHGANAEQLKNHYADRPLLWAEQTPPRGTGDAVAKALSLIPNHHQVLILYGDVPLISLATLQRLIAQTQPNNIGLLTIETDNPFGLGRIIRDDKTKQIIKIVEEKDATQAQRKITEANTGIFYLSASILNTIIPQLSTNNAQQEYYLTDIIELAVKNNINIESAHPLYSTEILGVNDRHQQAQVESAYQLQAAQYWQMQGVHIVDPHRFDLRGTLTANNDVLIDINVILEGQVSLGQGTKVGAHCVLINCEIGENVTILPFCHLEGVRIGNNTKIGPYARLRPGTDLKENVHIGNFVEIKNSTIDDYSKVNHLSYIGDTLMGKSVNIGAGTITCNYDGAHKYQTIIEDDVFIGSDTQLIAPVRVGKGATLGAGTTLKQDAPPDHLTLTQRLEQRFKPWKRPTKNEKG